MNDIVDLAATSTAATPATEPEVVAAISSAEGNPRLPLSFTIGGASFGIGGLALLLAAGVALGYGMTRWLRRNRPR